MASDFYDRQGQRVTMKEFGDLIHRPGYRRVAEDQIANVWISTIWLGTDYNFLEAGAPIIFETMIFGGPYDQQQWRYATEAEALAGHEKAVEWVRFGRACMFAQDGDA